MKDCPICRIQTDNVECDCGYSFDKEEIVSKDKIQAYIGHVKTSEHWSEWVKAKRRVHNIQIDKHGSSSTDPHGNDGWPQKKTAALLGESRENVSRDIKLAKAVDKYPVLKNERSKSAAQQRLRRIKGNDGLDPVPKRFETESKLQHFLEHNWNETELAEDWQLRGGLDTREIGKIDLLAKHRQKPIWLVIELKMPIKS